MSRLLVACCVWTIAMMPSPLEAQERVLGPGLESEVTRLTFPNGAAAELAGDVHIDGVQIEQTHIEVALVGEGRAGRVDLFARGASSIGWDAGQTSSFDVRLVRGADDALLRDAAIALRNRIDARDDGGFFDSHATPVEIAGDAGALRLPIFHGELRALRAVLWSLTLLGLLVLTVWMRRDGVRIARVDLAIAVLLFAGSFLVRWLLPPWAPLHANDHGIAEMRGLTGDPRGYEAWLYGSAYLDALRFALAPFGRAPSGPFAIAALAGALVPVVVFALARSLVPNARAGALLAALAVALHAGHVRLSTSESPKPLAELLWIGGAALAAWAFRAEVAPRTRDLAFVLCAFTWSLALELHVLTVLLPIAGALMVVIAVGRRASAPRWPAAIVGALVIALTTALHAIELDGARSAAAERRFGVLDLLDRSLGPDDVLFDPSITPWLVVPFAIAIGIASVWRGERRLVLGLTLAAAILLLPSLLIDACRTDAIRYQSESQLPIVLLLAGLSAPAALGRWRQPALAAALIALVVSSIHGLVDVAQPDVHAQAYAIAIARAPAAPAPILVLPTRMRDEPRVLSQFPDYAIDDGARVTTDRGASPECRVWIGVPCWSFTDDETEDPALEITPGAPMRRECIEVLGGIDRARAAVGALEPTTVPHRAREFHRIRASSPRIGYAPCP